jgi:hypothetical protein
MNVGKTLFVQIKEYIPWTSFARIVDRYAGNSGVRRMTCAEQFRIMAFAQLTWRESLRDIEVTLGANVGKLYAMGLRNAVHRSTLADANETRDWRIWSDFAAMLIRRARKLSISAEDFPLFVKISRVEITANSAWTLVLANLYDKPSALFVGKNWTLIDTQKLWAIRGDTLIAMADRIGDLITTIKYQYANMDNWTLLRSAACGKCSKRLRPIASRS